MHNLIGVHAANRRDDVVHYVTGFFLRKVVLLNDNVKELRPLAILGDDVLELPLLKDLVDLDDTWMVLDNTVSTKLLSKEISLRIMLLDLANLKVLIFLMALMWPVASCSAMKTSP